MSAEISEKEAALCARIKAHWQSIGKEEKLRRRALYRTATETQARIASELCMRLLPRPLEQYPEWITAKEAYERAAIEYFGE